MPLCWMHLSLLSNKSPRWEILLHAQKMKSIFFRPDAAGMEEAIDKFLDGLEGQESCHFLKISYTCLYLFQVVCESL
jgi:hypothetical protein